MRHADHMVALTVEAPMKGVVVIRMAGNLDQSTAPRLVDVLDSQLQFRTTSAQPSDPATASRTDVALTPIEQHYHLVIDLANVRFVGPDGLDALRHAHHVAQQTAMTLHLSGLNAHTEQPPKWTVKLITEFRTFVNLDQVLASLTSPDADRTENLAAPRGLRQPA